MAGEAQCGYRWRRESLSRNDYKDELDSNSKRVRSHTSDLGYTGIALKCAATLPFLRGQHVRFFANFTG